MGIAAYVRPENKVARGFVDRQNNKIPALRHRACDLRDEECRAQVHCSGGVLPDAGVLATHDWHGRHDGRWAVAHQPHPGCWPPFFYPMGHSLSTAAVLARRVGRLARFYMVSRRNNLSRCSVCNGPAEFAKVGPLWREHYLCRRCGASPRNRAFMSVLEAVSPRWRECAIHEPSPWGAASEALARQCRRHVATQYYPDVPPGEQFKGIRCENLERLTFGDVTFDLVVTQDVMEHVLEPGRAFAEIARTLTPGGAHVFTVPFYDWRKTVVRAARAEQGVEFLEPPQYHGNPFDDQGSLVTVEWGNDMVQYIERATGMQTAIYGVLDRSLLRQMRILYVFVSRKSDRQEED